MQKIVANTELQNAAALLGIDLRVIHLADSNFVLFTPADVTGLLAREYTKLLIQTGYAWIDEAFDCDNHALWATAWATRWHADNVVAGRAPRTGISFGEIWIQNKSHAVVCAGHVGAATGGIEFACYEPQRSGFNQVCFEPVEMSPADWASVILLKMQ